MSDYPGWGVMHNSGLACGCDDSQSLLCFKHKLRTIQFGGLPTRKTEMEKRWDRDMPAYQRLRMNGLQPPKIDGCADLETRAHSQTEIEMGHLVDRKLLPKVEEGMAVARELDWTPKDSVESVKDKYHRSPT